MDMKQKHGAQVRTSGSMKRSGGVSLLCLLTEGLLWWGARISWR